MRLIKFMIISSLMITFSCSKPKGTCESSVINYQGYQLYLCKEDQEEYLCEGSDDAFYTDKSCSDLGYGYLDSDGYWQYSSTDNGTPGPYGKWGSGGSSGSGLCSGGYVSPTSDPQLNGYCGYAYHYRCVQGKSLSDPGVKASCEYYNTMREPGVPDCKYCK